MTKSFDNKLVVKSTTDNLAKIRDFIRNSARTIGFEDDIIGKIILAVDEACTNIIKHAYRYNSEGIIEINIKSEKSKFTIQITDNGINFDPEAIPEPDIKEYHKQHRSGGLGMFLIKKLMDEVQYRNLANNRNQVTLVKYL